MSQQRKIILASISPGRKKLMEQMGVDFSVEPSNYEEDMSLKVSPTELVSILSQEKARAVAEKHNDAIVIGADSVAVLRGNPVGKPKNREDAKKILQGLSGQMHVFTTGLTVIDTKSKEEITEVKQTNVYFRKLSEAEIEGYVATEEWEGRAGAYEIQGKGAMLVEKIEGDYTNVRGLSLPLLASILVKLGVNPV